MTLEFGVTTSACFKAALKNNFSSEAGTPEARTPEKQAFLANLRWIAEVIFERRLSNYPKTPVVLM